MQKVEPVSQVALRNILFLTDFSAPSEAALPFATSFARGHGSKVFALHVFAPESNVRHLPGKLAEAAIAAGEQSAEMRIESELAGLDHETLVEWNTSVWEAVEKAIREHEIDLVVLGTHGRTGAEKFLLGSVAEEIFRRSPVPVLTIGPDVRTGTHGAGKFRRILFATDFTDASLAAAPYAVSLAHENQARLVLVHVMRLPGNRDEREEKRFEISVAEAIHRLYETLPKGMEFHTPPEVLVEYGDAAERILGVAKERGTDLIVLGLRDAAGRLGAATHLERATAHKVVAHAMCPVLTVRGNDRES